MLHDESRRPPSESPRLFADVIVPRHIAKSFTYLVPAHLTPAMAIGRRVVVPFGRTKLEGAVVELRASLPTGIHGAHLKEILSVADSAPDLPPALFELSRRVADEYLAPWGQCLRLVLPPGRPSAEPSPRYLATDEGRTALRTEICPIRLRPLLSRIARRSSGVLASTLASRPGSGAAHDLQNLEKKGWIARIVRPQAAPVPSKAKAKGEGQPALSLQTGPPMTLLPPDPTWTERLDSGFNAHAADRLLVHAPWRHRLSLLVHALEQAHALGKSALIIVGEVARVEWLGRMIAETTKFPVTLLHSDLDEATRLIRWEQIHRGAPAIVIGTRSAVFAPLRSIGLIWIDGEEDPALKEPQEPRYHARDVAWMRAQTERSLLVLGSSHPSLESYWAAGARSLRALVSDVHRPFTDVVDLRLEPSGVLFSSPLLAGIRETLERKDRVLLYLNRKGFAGALVCRDCGLVPRCPSCAVAFTFFRQTSTLSCRYCGASIALPETCPACGAARFHPVGEGTERVEAEARRLFPKARILRLDGDTLRHTASARRLWETALSGDWDILIGTQVLFQRGPLPAVALAGIVQADSGMSVPDFRAAERTYQLLGDAIDLVRPAASASRVILQTALPIHHVIQSLIDWNPARFYEEELAARQLLGYPPLTHLVSLSVSGKDRTAVEQAARQLARLLEEASTDPGTSSPARSGGRPHHLPVTPPATAQDRITILGPVPAIGGRPRGYHRHQIIVKGRDRTLLHQAVRRSLKTVEGTDSRKRVKVTIDVDPIEMG